MNCSQAQEFYSLIVLNVPCWHSQGLLQRLDPIAVWVYGLRYRRGRHAKLFLPSFLLSSRGFRSVCTSGLLLLIFMCWNIFNHDPYKHKRSPHFLSSLRTDIERHSPGEVLFSVKCGILTALSKPSVNVCSVWKSSTKTELIKVLILFLKALPLSLSPALQFYHKLYFI